MSIDLALPFSEVYAINSHIHTLTYMILCIYEKHICTHMLIAVVVFKIFGSKLNAH